MAGNMKKYQHGGDWAGYQLEYGREPLDFSANVSPLGLPESVREAVIASLEHADRYPDPECRRLRRLLSAKHGIRVEQILCGNGAADLIDRLVRAVKPGKALITAPTFGEYRVCLERAGCQVQEYYLDEKTDFRPDEEILDSITPDTDLVFICEPNNPTGVTGGKNLLRKIHEKCLAAGAILVLDECFNDFLDKPQEHSLLPDIGKGNLLILRAFTKFYGMAGLRLGYAVSGDRELLYQMSCQGQPWNVSYPAQEAGCGALRASSYGKALSELVYRERAYLAEALSKLGCRVIPGEANYLLFYHKDHELWEKLRKEGILIRSCGNYAGLGLGWYRIAVRKPEENQRLIREMGKVVSQ